MNSLLLLQLINFEQVSIRIVVSLRLEKIKTELPPLAICSRRDPRSLKALDDGTLHLVRLELLIACLVIIEDTLHQSWLGGMPGRQWRP